MSIMSNNEEWLTIPGFPGYKINKKDATILSSKRAGKAGKIKSLTKGRSVTLIPESGRKIATTPQRILYAAMHGIDPRKIPRNLLVYTGEDGETVLLSDSEIIKTIAAKRKARTAYNISERYERIINFSKLIMSCYDSGDYGPVCTEIYSYKGQITAFLRKQYNISEAETIRAIWGYVSDETIKRITERSAAIPDPIYYLRAVTRASIARMRKEKKRLRYIDDPDDYLMDEYR